MLFEQPKNWLGLLFLFLGFILTVNYVFISSPGVVRTSFVLNGEAVEVALQEMALQGLDVSQATFEPKKVRIRERYFRPTLVRVESRFSEGTITLYGVGPKIYIRFIVEEPLRNIDGTLKSVLDIDRCGRLPLGFYRYREHKYTYRVVCEGGSIRLPTGMQALLVYNYQVASTDLVPFDPESKYNNQPLFPFAEIVLREVFGYPCPCSDE